MPNKGEEPKRGKRNRAIQGKDNRRKVLSGNHRDTAQSLAFARDFRLIEGKNPVIEALKIKGRVQKIYMLPASLKSPSVINTMAEEQGIPRASVDRDDLDRMASSTEHQGVLALAHPFNYTDLYNLLNSINKKGQQPFLIILDHIEDPHNLGSLIRTADAAGVHGVILPNKRAVGITSAVGKASAGAIEHMPIVRVTNLVQTIETLKDRGIWVVGADMDGEQELHRVDLNGPIALAIGAEGKGLYRLVKEACDQVIQIPMHGRIASLNASVAGALLMYEVVRHRSNRC